MRLPLSGNRRLQTLKWVLVQRRTKPTIWAKGTEVFEVGGYVSTLSQKSGTIFFEGGYTIWAIHVSPTRIIALSPDSSPRIAQIWLIIAVLGSSWAWLCCRSGGQFPDGIYWGYAV